jgi:hypothetical protein
MAARITKRLTSLLVALLLFILGGIFALIHLRKPTSTVSIRVVGPRLRIDWALELKGSNIFYLPAGGNVLGSEGLGSKFEGDLRHLIKKLGLGVETLPVFSPGKSDRARAFLVCYSFVVPPRSSTGLTADLVDEVGAQYHLNNPAGGGGGPPDRSWALWTLDGVPPGVSNYTVQLRLPPEEKSLAEIKFSNP